MDVIRDFKRIVSVALILAMLACTAGCGDVASSLKDISVDKISETVSEAFRVGTDDTAEDDTEEEIELIEPVGATIGFDYPVFMEMAVIKTFQGIICPKTREYSYTSAQKFGRYGALPGDSVSEGDMLFTGESADLEEQIEDIEEENIRLLESFNDTTSDYLVDLRRAKKDEYKNFDDFIEFSEDAPAEDEPAYRFWLMGYKPIESNTRKLKLARERLEEAQRQKQELFDLEYAYNEKRISRIREKIQASTVNATENGVVVAAQYYYAGDNVPEGSTIMAVGDTDELVIRSDYISKSVVNKAVDLYAIIDGERFEVQYENMEPEEYRRLLNANDVVYTTFYIKDPEHKATLGKLAVIVVVSDKKENALCVPSDAIHRDENGTYVYLYENGDSVYHQVQTGKVDGAYTEITYGLTAEQPIVYDPTYNIGSKQETIKKGSLAVHFSTDGYLFYPTAEWITNPAKSGTSYLKEMRVVRFQQIKKGDVMAVIEVTSDDVSIGRLNRKIERHRQRLADLQKDRAEINELDEEKEGEILTLERAIRDRQRSIEDLNRQIEKLKSTSGLVEITAPYDGLVIDVPNIEEGSIINYKQGLMQIADDDSSCIVVEDKNGILSFGDKAEVEYRDRSGTTSSINGQVVTMNPRGLTKSMITGYSMIRVPREEFAAIAGEGSDAANGYWARNRYTVTADVKSMDNVLLIPKSASLIINGDTYVIVENDDKTHSLVKFVAGGSDNVNYWVAYGDITEGMTICSGS